MPWFAKKNHIYFQSVRILQNDTGGISAVKGWSDGAIKSLLYERVEIVLLSLDNTFFDGRVVQRVRDFTEATQRIYTKRRRRRGDVDVDYEQFGVQPGCQLLDGIGNMFRLLEIGGEEQLHGSLYVTWVF